MNYLLFCLINGEINFKSNIKLINISSSVLNKYFAVRQ